MLKTNVYSAKGVKVGTMSLPSDFSQKVNLALLAQAIRVYEDKSHTGSAVTKTRAEVNRTKKKWYKQKGTGGARHGARSAPIFVGGGVAHGPRGVKRELTLSKKLTTKALKVALSAKAKDNQVVVSRLSELKSTKDAGNLIKKLGVKKGTFILKEENKEAERFLRNLKNIEVVEYRNLNAYKALLGGTLIFDKDVFEKEKKVKKETK